MKTDLVITYVNNKDELWRKKFIDYCFSHKQPALIAKIYNNRYNGTNWIKYQLKLVEENMKFIDKIYLVVSNKEQVNGLSLPTNTIVVTHDKIIPQRFLPTFNSTTIEMFLPLINGLNEQFIYANDDMLPLKPLRESDFFENGKVKINLAEEKFDVCLSQFKWQCFNNCFLIRNTLKTKGSNTLIRPIHSMTPMLKSHCLEIFCLERENIYKRVSVFRNEYNYNQYLFAIYEFYKYGVLPSKIDFLYTEFKEEFELNHDIICVNEERDMENVKKFLEKLKRICV